MDNDELLDIEEIEIELLLLAIFKRYGYNFKEYDERHIKRRVLNRVELSAYKSISDLTRDVLFSRDLFNQLLLDLSINVTEMFRFPMFFKELRESVVPLLKTYPTINIWHAGCSTGEEVLSMAIFLKEEGLLERTKIYATDINKDVLKIAKRGIYPISEIKKWTKNYQDSGGKNSFSSYYTAKYDSVIMNESLYKNILFSEHNLTQDRKFICANLIICRNVLIYFNKSLKEKVLELFDSSLVHDGVIGVGSRENIRFSNAMKKFDVLSSKGKLYRKKIE